MNKTLDEIALEHGTDKASKHQHKGHNYCVHYARFFDALRDQPIKFLEIGVGGGESMRAWLEFFPSATIYGVDIVHDTNPWNTKDSGLDRYIYTEGDQSSEAFWKEFIDQKLGQWDVIIDDGGHYANQVQTSFQCLWPHIKPGGLYCIEDLACSYSEIFLPAGSEPPIEMLKRKVDEINQAGEIECAFFSKELAILKKAASV